MGAYLFKGHVPIILKCICSSIPGYIVDGIYTVDCSRSVVGTYTCNGTGIVVQRHM